MPPSIRGVQVQNIEVEFASQGICVHAENLVAVQAGRDNRTSKRKRPLRAGVPVLDEAPVCPRNVRNAVGRSHQIGEQKATLYFAHQFGALPATNFPADRIYLLGVAVGKVTAFKFLISCSARRILSEEKTLVTCK